MIFLCPIAYTINDISTNHLFFRGNLISTLRGIGIFPVLHTIEMIAGGFIKTIIKNSVCMVKYHIHNHANSLTVKSLDHGFKLPNTNSSIIWIGTIGALRHKIIQRIISPVITICLSGLIHTSKIVGRHQLDMGYT